MMKKLLLLSFFCAGVSQAQVTRPETIGLNTYHFDAGSSLSYRAISLPAVSSYAGPVLSASANALTFSGTPFTPSALAQAGSPYFALVMTGPQAGRSMLVTANSNNSVTLDVTDNTSTSFALNTSYRSIAPGDLIRVFAGDTLSSFFGNSASTLSLVQGGATAGAADTVSIYNQAAKKFDTYFFNTTAGQWRKNGSSANANGVVLYPEAAMGILRRAGRPVAVGGISGTVATTPPWTRLNGFTLIYTSSRFPVDMTLGDLTALNITPGSTTPPADTLSIYNSASSKWISYYLNGTTWLQYKVAGSKNSTPVPAGSAIAILKRAAANNVGPSQPLPYAFIPELPYTLDGE